MPDSIAHYRLGAKLGQGAMGEVYRATDTKLGRDVAIKLIAPNLTQDAARMSSFAREAQVLASLNHPNIAAIYGVEDQALVMELVEGPTLADRIKQGPLPLDEALAIARQIADGLEAAHDKGIVHRDLKPGNIKITPDGTVKLLDFGLAKAAAVASAPADEAMTIALSMTGGLIVGTPGYMSPEQARGRPVDKRADIWAFGVVLYEMLTGTTLFEGDTVTDVMASVVRQEPDLARVPAAVRPLLARCLEKDPKRRLRDIGDAMLLLESAPAAAKAGPVSHQGRKMLWLAWTAAALFLLTSIGLLLVYGRDAAPVANTVRFKIALPEGLSFTPTAQFGISPDGQKLAFIAQAGDRASRVWIQELGALEPRLLPGSDVNGNTGLLVWSPDSRFLVSQHDQKLIRIDVSGGPAQTIADHQGPAFGGSWHANGTIIFGTLTGVMQVSASGGTPALVTKTDASRRELTAFPAFLPDGRAFVYMRGGATRVGQRALYLGSLDAKPEEQPTTSIVVTDLGGGLVPVPGSSTEGRVLFQRDDTLVSQRFDTKQRQLIGEAEPVAQQLLFGDFPYSASGSTLVYRSGTAPGRVRRLAWFDRDGKALDRLTELALYTVLKLSPDATRAVTARPDSQTGSNTDLWITDLAQDTSSRFTFDAEPDVQPTWSPDGKYIAWVGVRKGTPGIYRKPSDGAGGDELLHKFDSEVPANLTDWSTDGRFLVYNRAGDVWALPVGAGTDSTRQPIPVVQTSGTDFGAYVSPDRRWISYISNESGRQEIYVQPFAPGWSPAAGGTTPVGGKWMVSRGGLGMNRWRADGKELLFVAADGVLMSVDVSLSPVFKASAPRPLFKLPQAFLALGQNPGAIADVSRDHQRILLVMPSEEATRQEMTVVLNWQSGLSR